VRRAGHRDHQGGELGHHRLGAARAIAKTRKPVIVSTGGASVRDMDAMVTFFANRQIPLA
jgi:sialic acid synthase SpsE